jgi:hypothetical protein
MDACLELVKRRSVVSHRLYRWQLSKVVNEGIQITEVLVRGQQRLTDLRANGKVNDMGAFARQILEGIMGAILRAKWEGMLVCRR